MGFKKSERHSCRRHSSAGAAAESEDRCGQNSASVTPARLGLYRPHRLLVLKGLEACVSKMQLLEKAPGLTGGSDPPQVCSMGEHTERRFQVLGDQVCRGLKPPAVPRGGLFWDFTCAVHFIGQSCGRCGGQTCVFPVFSISGSRPAGPACQMGTAHWSAWKGQGTRGPHSEGTGALDHTFREMPGLDLACGVDQVGTLVPRPVGAVFVSG